MIWESDMARSLKTEYLNVNVIKTRANGTVKVKCKGQGYLSGLHQWQSKIQGVIIVRLTPIDVTVNR